MSNIKELLRSTYFSKVICSTKLGKLDHVELVHSQWFIHTFGAQKINTKAYNGDNTRSKGKQKLNNNDDDFTQYNFKTKIDQ